MNEDELSNSLAAWVPPWQRPAAPAAPAPADQQTDAAAENVASEVEASEDVSSEIEAAEIEASENEAAQIEASREVASEVAKPHGSEPDRSKRRRVPAPEADVVADSVADSAASEAQC